MYCDHVDWEQVMHYQYLKKTTTSTALFCTHFLKHSICVSETSMDNSLSYPLCCDFYTTVAKHDHLPCNSKIWLPVLQTFCNFIMCCKKSEMMIQMKKTTEFRSLACTFRVKFHEDFWKTRDLTLASSRQTTITMSFSAVTVSNSFLFPRSYHDRCP